GPTAVNRAELAPGRGLPMPRREPLEESLQCLLTCTSGGATLDALEHDPPAAHRRPTVNCRYVSFSTSPPSGEFLRRLRERAQTFTRRINHIRPPATTCNRFLATERIRETSGRWEAR